MRNQYSIFMLFLVLIIFFIFHLIIDDKKKKEKKKEKRKNGLLRRWRLKWPSLHDDEGGFYQIGKLKPLGHVWQHVLKLSF